jgi:uncharacterized iron-regulated membrane protein
MFRRTFLFLHRWLGLIASLPLVLLGISGAIIVFESELDQASNARLWSVKPVGERQPWQTIVDRAHHELAAEPRSLRLPISDDQAAEVSFAKGKLVYVDPYSGDVLGSRLRGEILLGRIHQFHTKLLIGKNGSLVMGISSLLLVFLSLSGLVLWWRTKVWSFPVRLGTKRWNFDVHSALGLYALLFWLVLGASGAFMTFEGVSHAATYWLTRTEPLDPPRLQSSDATGRERISIDEVVKLAQQKLPEAVPTDVMFPRQAGDVFLVTLKFPEDRTPAGRSRIYVDAYSGEILWTTDARNVPLGTWLLNHNRPLHTGDLFGWPSRILMGAASLLLPLQIYTGAVLWWRGRRAKRARVAPTSP